VQAFAGNQPGGKFKKFLADGGHAVCTHVFFGFTSFLQFDEEEVLSSEASSNTSFGKTWFLGTGRRKESIARVFLRPGSGKFTVNGRPVEQYFPNYAWKHDATEPVKFSNLTDQIDVVVTAKGGGVGGQAGAVRMGLSRAISKFNPELRPALRKNGFLTRDSRMKERKKYGQKGARKRFQFTKR
jgi:small subunit ribosomal protein S9